jgi:hypothetical protein
MTTAARLDVVLSDVAVLFSVMASFGRMAGDVPK